MLYTSVFHFQKVKSQCVAFKQVNNASSIKFTYISPCHSSSKTDYGCDSNTPKAILAICPRAKRGNGELIFCDWNSD